jgi:deazaflavin-dependent oxidoreductase (nitroreductase family)
MRFLAEGRDLGVSNDRGAPLHVTDVISSRNFLQATFDLLIVIAGASSSWCRAKQKSRDEARVQSPSISREWCRLVSYAATEASMSWASSQDIVDQKVLYLTTIGRRTGLPREIEIWFVVYRGRFYLFAETGEAANWVKNIRCNPKVTVRIGDWQVGATARVLDHSADRKLWDEVTAIADRKYGWGEGLPVEVAPYPPPVSDAIS